MIVMLETQDKPVTYCGSKQNNHLLVTNVFALLYPISRSVEMMLPPALA